MAAIALLSPINAFADICKRVIGAFYFAEESPVKNPFFDKYLIGKKHGVYYVYASKTTEINFSHLVSVLQEFNRYPDFMLGYKSVKTRQMTDTTLLTSILFSPPLSPFTSQFTNEVEILSGLNHYQQCWRQLPEDDSRIEEKHRNAPIVNSGYWALEKLRNNGTRISYHSAIKPPIPLPLFAYKFFVRNSYVETFERIFEEAARRTIKH